MDARDTETSAAHRGGEAVSTKLSRIAERARSQPRAEFTSLFHLMNEELLRDCFTRLSASSAAGIDKVTKGEYGKDLEQNLTKLVGRLQAMAYRPNPVRRVYIPKAGTDKLRPLGIACLEDKLVQAGLVRILEAIYEQDFVEDSYGFRPGRGCHDALRALGQTIERRPIRYVVEADIKGFFDAVDREWLLRMVSHRIKDERVLRMIRRFLKAGVLEGAEVSVGETGTVQGGVISPMLANIYLHYTLDLWFERVFAKSCQGVARLIRYADDYVACFQTRADAERFEAAMIERLKQFGLEVEPAKTKMLEFGRAADEDAKRRGGKPGTFDFLGLTHYCGTTRNGKRFEVGRVTSAKKLRAKLAAIKDWLKRDRTKPIGLLWERMRAILRGHYAYYGVTGNSRGIRRFDYEVRRLFQKWMNRRGKRGAFDWGKFSRMEERFPLPRPRIQVALY